MSINLEARPDDNLKWCPFCGGEDVEIQNTHTAAYWVACNDCEAMVPGRAFGTNSTTTTMRQHQLAKASAVKAWNRRCDDRT